MMSSTQHPYGAVERARRRHALIRRYIALATITIPTAITVYALTTAVLDRKPPTLFVLTLTSFMYVITMLGVTVGFHRLIAHRSFETSRPVLGLLAILGSMSAQGSPLFWVSEHRDHHRCSDREGDPHTPHLDGIGRPVGLRGAWHAHIGWMTEHTAPAWAPHIADLLRDPTLRFVDRWYFLWVTAGILVPGILTGLWYGSLSAAVTGLTWGGFVRIFLVHHATWSVNSLCHMAGTRPFATPDLSRNNGLVALVTLGEGWHNNHHAFPNSARHGLARDEPDLTYLVICILAWLGGAKNIRSPPEDRIEQLRAPKR